MQDMQTILVQKGLCGFLKYTQKCWFERNFPISLAVGETFVCDDVDTVVQLSNLL